MVRPYAHVGRPLSSSAGSVPSATNCNAVPRKLYGLAGQPGRVTTVLPSRTVGAPVAPVGLGSAEGMPPHDAQDPMAMMAPASAATSFTIWSAVLPAILQ